MFEKLVGHMAHRFKTPQEVHLEGSTDGFEPGAQDWYSPMALHDGIELPNIISERNKFGFYVSSIAGIGAGLDGSAVITLAKLDLRTGLTLNDPLLFGFLNDKDEIVPLKSDEYTRRMVEFFIRTKSDPFYRKQIGVPKI